MDFSLTEQQQQTKDMIERLASEKMAPRARELEERAEFPRENIQLLAEQGLMGLLLPPPFGGAGADLTTLTIVVEALSKACPATALAFGAHAASSLGVLAHGSDEQRGRYLKGFCDGSSLVVTSLTESGGGSSPMAAVMPARQEGDEFVLNGSKLFVTATGEADVYLVVARTDPKPGPTCLTVFIVDKDTPGLSFGKLESKLGMRSLPTGELLFEDCRLPASAVLGTVGGALKVFPVIATVGALTAAAMGVGVAQAAVDQTQRYLLERTVAGQRLADNATVQTRFADMSMELNAARALLCRAIYDKENSPPGPVPTILQAKVFATEKALKIVDQAIQLHGVYGYTTEFPLEKSYRDIRAMTIHFGVSDAVRSMISKVILGLL